MVKKWTEDNLDSKYQMAQYQQFNTVLEALKASDQEQDVLIAERDDHAVERSGTGAGGNQKAVLQEHDSEVWEGTHDYADHLMTKLQATATLLYGLGTVDEVPVEGKQVVYTKALQITPSSAHQVMHDLYRQLEDRELKNIFYNTSTILMDTLSVFNIGGWMEVAMKQSTRCSTEYCGLHTWRELELMYCLSPTVSLVAISESLLRGCKGP